MAVVTMPQFGESITEGTILAWLKQPGDEIRLDEPLCEIETEKVTDELPSPFAGRLERILVAEGETVAVDTPLCEIAEPGGPPTEPAAAAAPLERPVAVDEPRLAPQPPPEEAAPAATAEADGYSPAVRRLAAEHSIDLASVTGTGAEGRVTRRDVEALIAADQPVNDEYEVVTLSATRRSIADNLLRSVTEAPQAWMMVEADVTALLALRAEQRDTLPAEEQSRLTVLPYFTRAVCQALAEFPALNARWQGTELRRYARQHIGIAVASEAGLVVPVIHDAGELTVLELAARIADLADRAHARRLKVEDVERGTFTVNNTGAFGSIVSRPIVNHPQVAIVTMERVTKRPVVTEAEEITVRSVMNMCLTFDHRALDGAEAGAFLASLKRRLETPDR